MGGATRPPFLRLPTTAPEARRLANGLRLSAIESMPVVKLHRCGLIQRKIRARFQ
jgi:hypothetical protein